MKSGLTVVLFRLFTIGVFVGGKESNGELVSVMEGDLVTLMSGVTEIQADDEIEWEFNGISLATISIDSGKWFKPDGPFRNRLQLDNKTGDLKISNIKTKDSGLYKVMISSPDGSPEMTFTVKVVSADEVKSVSVMEGGSVTLRTDLTEIQGYDVIRWRFGQQKSPVAEINRMGRNFIRYDGPDERFRDRLTLNNQTGSLTITNINTTDAGLYEADISSGKYTIHKSFSVTVSDVKSVLLMERDSVTLRTGLTEIQRDDEILWKFEDQDIARLNGSVNKKWSNIDLNSMTGDLTIRNIRRDQRGDYKVEIITRRMILHSKYSITVGSDLQSGSGVQSGSGLQSDSGVRSGSGLQSGSGVQSDSGVQSGSGLSPGAVAGIVVVVALLAAAVGAVVGAAVVVMYYRRKNSEPEGQREENGVNLNTQKTDDAATEETKLDDS